MDDFLAARSQMALSLGFHIIYSCIGMVMPVFMAISHYKWIKTQDPVYKNITVAWSKGVAIFFATGAVSGTMLSFELGLLWPGFMKHAGPIFGMPFSLEGVAFFIEAIALGLFLYGWNKLNNWVHWTAGVIVGISGVASGILVVSANSWMNSPSGFDFVNGQYVNIDPVKAMFNKAWFSESLHMIIAAFSATGFAVAGIHALMIYRKKNIAFHTKAFKIAIIFGAAAAILQPFSGDLSAKNAAKRQPAKLAAMEAYFHTQEYAPLVIGGIPDTAAKKVNYGLEIPGLLSFLVHDNFKTQVNGLDKIPVKNQPPVAVTHYAFQIMVGIGVLMMLIGIIYFYELWKKKDLLSKPWFLKTFIWATPLGFIALEAGWTVTEVGRQPWIIQGVMRTSEAVTPMPGIQYSFYLFSFIYFTLSVAVIFLLKRQIQMVPELYDRKTAQP
ncbi:cytochrome ubiquinol oxidase subunit I [Mucilaginibacter rubeus]|uniref:Cytochrome ubiquinol oxidase subunit I n=1 Tax=Mucilaginibacter rubeus TaxID=2027860 RepID=A0AAE6JE06_9SPHI|nr:MULTISPECIES: cytochrome ubiquinol oxidase subunit I [Mucilaginibacter]QEM03835.1 cytochrome ubiquinol oxidase subunit I [Mucilaginibacter rubeus]QEM16445.1 cytochrome ubiquinol oxidase subunit I [Mucilaginibacter gossypii]QTE40787.1 cytochrome ubiquinol oxidase subunit I [Mucilaginibacter rubeus]QTE47389.1 cytochrome ubiquinol oxidase subunit I [Mucilaginibacter rubeus]QTE58783.1 cytochrome ubiquinol oxidase subunit I [Mucilaginibacter rubeus]